MTDNQNSPEGFQARITAANEQAAQEAVENLMPIVSDVYGKAQALINVVILAGYAGLFAIWNFVQSLLTPLDIALVATLLIASILVFVAWEVFKMVVVSVQSRQAVFLIQNSKTTEQLTENVQKYQTTINKQNVALYRYWWVVLTLTVLPALAAIVILLYRLLLQVWTSFSSS
jgi:hypothetical protein